MDEKKILKAYEAARERYAELGIDTDKAVAQLEQVPISLHCWQTDDVVGFERNVALSGGIQTTGNYPGRARNVDEVRQDIIEVKSLLAGNHRLNLHETYGEFGDKFVDRDEVEVKHFQGWIDWAKQQNLKLDFNSTSFSHPKSGNLTLSNPDDDIRNFWIEHTKRCRRIADAMGKAQDDPCIMNIWVHDGSKDLTVNRLHYRQILKNSLDEILSEQLPHMKSCLEAKLFGIGLESYTVGSHDMVASLLLFVPELMLHVSRPVRWDSDHVTIMNDQTLDLFKELVRADALHRAHVGLDYFDASINRIGAYIIGVRATQRCLLSALLEPIKKLREYEAADKGFQRLALLEEAKSMPMGAVFDYFCLKNNVPVGTDYMAEVERYEREELSKRA